jgi:hypothetical protein
MKPPAAGTAGRWIASWSSAAAAYAERWAELNQVSRLLPVFVAAVIAASPCAISGAWPEEASVRMGLPQTTEGELDMRVWVGGGNMHPFTMYRLRKAGTEVQGQKFVWDEFLHSDDPATDRMFRKERRDMLQLLRREYCGRSLHVTDDFAWCEVSSSAAIDWPAVLADLRPERLWQLPEQDSLGPTTCSVMDGVGVGIEMVAGSREHHVVYWNPGQCCPWSECKDAQEVLEIVQRIH